MNTKEKNPKNGVLILISRDKLPTTIRASDEDPSPRVNVSSNTIPFSRHGQERRSRRKILNLRFEFRPGGILLLDANL